MQDTENAVRYGGLYLNYGSILRGERAALAVGDEIVSAFQAAGLMVDWDGSWEKRIGVSLDWKRRLPPRDPRAPSESRFEDHFPGLRSGPRNSLRGRYSKATRLAVS